MALQAPKGVNFEGRGVNATTQIGGRAESKGKVLAVTATTGRVILPVSSNTLPFAAYQITSIGSDAVYWRLGGSGIEVDHVSDAFDDVLPGGGTVTIANHEARTYIAGITESGTATLVVAGIV